MSRGGDPRDHVVPCYRAPEDEVWYHFLHGNVPGHQIDFMYRPEVPQGALSRQHYSHLARLISYIEPHPGAPYAFAIGNLSRDDTQHEPGHGGVALLFGLRIRGVTDHAGRRDPPFAHAIAAVDRALDAPAIFEAAIAFQRRVLGDAASAEWYRSYVRSGGEPEEAVERVLAGYVASFTDLPRPAPSALSLAWTTEGVTPLGRVVFVYPDDAPFDVVALAASRLCAVLYRSDVRWSAISTGREADLPNGVTVRLLPRSAVGPGDSTAALHDIESLPADDDAMAYELFGAKPVARRRGVAQRRARSDPPVSGGAQAGSVDEGPRSITVSMAGAGGDPVSKPPVAEPPPALPRRHSSRLGAAAGVVALGGLLVIAALSAERGPRAPREPVPPDAAPPPPSSAAAPAARDPDPEPRVEPPVVMTSPALLAGRPVAKAGTRAAPRKDERPPKPVPAAVIQPDPPVLVYPYPSHPSP